MSHQRRKPDHQCGEVMCRTCQEFIEPQIHRCYIKPIETEGEKQRQKKMKNRGGERQCAVNKFLDESAEEGEELDHEEEEQEYFLFDI